MHFALITCGLPGPGYHGGAMACWAVLRRMIESGHEATVISLYDTSKRNPYLVERSKQTEVLSRAGIQVESLEYDHAALERDIKFRHRGGGLLAKVRRAFDPPLEANFPWSAIGLRLREKMEGQDIDAACCYHFDALSAAAGSRVPLLALASDLFFVPAYYQWLRLKPSPAKYLWHLPDYLLYRRSCGRMLIAMLQACNGRITFMPHYVSWYARYGVADMEYCPTPVHDPLVGNRTPAREDSGVGKPRLLMIGDLAGTSAVSGLDTLVRETIPVLDSALGCEGYELHMVGAGTPARHARFLEDHPSVRLRGRVVPADDEFALADCLMVPNSIALGVRVKILTAFSFGTFVAAHRANAAGIPELTHGENCLLAYDGRDLGRQILRALQDEELRAGLAQNGRRIYERFFHERLAAGRIVERLETMARERA